MARLPHRWYFSGKLGPLVAVAPENHASCAYPGLSELGGPVHVFVMADFL